MDDQTEDEGFENPDGLAWPVLPSGYATNSAVAPQALTEHQGGNSNAQHAPGQQTSAEPGRLAPSLPTDDQLSLAFDPVQGPLLAEDGIASRWEGPVPPQPPVWDAGDELAGASPWLTLPPDSDASELSKGNTERLANEAADAAADAEDASVEQEIQRFCSSKSRRCLKPRILDQPLSPHVAELAETHRKPPTREFQRLFGSAQEANDALASLRSLYRKPREDCTTPMDDETFPATDEQAVAVVKQVFDAIADWTYILEWKSTLGQEAKSRVTATSAKTKYKKAATSRLDSFRPSREELASFLPSLDVQNKMVLSQVPSDQTTELICWGIVQAAAVSQQGMAQTSPWCEVDGG